MVGRQRERERLPDDLLQGGHGDGCRNPVRRAAGAEGGGRRVDGRRPGRVPKEIVNDFDQIYRSKRRFWTVAPSNPQPSSLFSDAPTYLRPAAAYVALRQILGHRRFTKVLEHVQHTYGGSSITEPQLETAFHRWLPVKTSACQTRLTQFFTQWFDTAYAPGGGETGRGSPVRAWMGEGFTGRTGGAAHWPQAVLPPRPPRQLDLHKCGSSAARGDHEVP